MSLLEQAKQDIQDITSNLDEFGVEMTFTAPTGETATIAGLHKKVRHPFDTEGNLVDTTTAVVSFSEALLTEQAYPVRTNGKVDLQNHTIAVKDSTDTTKNYKVKSWYPDQTLGFIVVILATKA